MMYSARLAFVLLSAILGLTKCQESSKDLLRCRQMCYEKFFQDWHHCMDFEDCKNMCITPPNINSYIPEAFSFLCWNSCDQALGPFPLNINSAARQGSLVLTDIGWDQAVTNASKQCLVTWEVSGGGLMGNLLTDSSTVELSLWPDTVYHVQVTCKNKQTGGMRRSFKLIVDTKKLNGGSNTIQPISMDTTNMKILPNLYPSEPISEIDSIDRMKILKDSSKDFVNTYNPTSINTYKNEKQEERDSHIEANIISSRTNSILRSKLASAVPVVQTTEAMTRSIIYAMIGALVLFFTLLLVYILTRSKEETPIDKEELIRNEIGVNASPTPVNRTLHV